MTRGLRLLAAGAACSGALWLVHPADATADSTAATVTVGDAAEAWYQTAPGDTCSAPVGCPPTSTPSPYPAGTLHVGVLASTQTAATYVQPDLSAVPPGESAVAGTMTLPLATVSGNGSANTAGAAITACLLTGPITDGVSGSTAAPPASNCKTSAPVKAGTTSFSLDLAPFLTAWNSGRPQYGIALLADTAQPGAWHVAFDGRNLSGAPHIASALTLAPAGAGDLSGPAPSGTIFGDLSQPASPLSPSPLQVFNPAVPVTPSLASPAAPTPAPATANLPASPTPERQPAGSVLAGVSHGFQYPEILLLPLGLAAGMAFVLRLLLSDATPKRKPA